MAYTPGEPTFRLSSMAPPKKRRTGLIAAAIAGGVFVVALGAGGIGYALAGREPAAAPAPAPVVSSEAASPSPSTGDRARQACGQLAAASRVEDVYKADDLPRLKAAADAAADADNTSVALGGLLLQDVLTTSQAEHENGNDSDWPKSVAKAVQGLRRSCSQYGFPV